MTLQDARVVVTGGAGFIGSHLVDRLVADNEVLVVARAITAEADHNVFDLRTRTTTSVDRIADIVADEMGLEPAYAHTGGERGWTGDVPRMRLSVEKLAGLGWEPSQSSDEAVRQSTRELLAELEPATGGYYTGAHTRTDMDIRSRVDSMDTERALFTVGAIITGLLAVLVFRTGNDDQGALFAAFSIYLGGAATPLIRDNVTAYKRTGAIALAGVGIVAVLLGVQSRLPFLFIIGGIAALFNLF